MVITPGEIEQPEPVADGERVKIQRVPLAAVRAVSCLVCHRRELIHRHNLVFRIVHGRRSWPAQCYARPATLPGSTGSSGPNRRLGAGDEGDAFLAAADAAGALGAVAGPGRDVAEDDRQ